MRQPTGKSTVARPMCLLILLLTDHTFIFLFFLYFIFLMSSFFRSPVPTNAPTVNKAWNVLYLQGKDEGNVT